MDDFQKTMQTLGMNFLRFAIVLVIGVLVVRLILIPVKRLLLKSKLDHTAKTFLFSSCKVLLYAVIVVSALGTANVNISSILTALGAAALTAGLAIQDTLKNFVSGIILLFNKPISAGDLIQVDGYEGKVESIRLFYTKIVLLDNRVLQLPNCKLTSNNVVNCSEAGTRRVDLTFSVSYEDSIAKVKSVIYDVIAADPQLLDVPEAKVYIAEHLDSGLKITVFVWANQEDYYAVKFRMTENVKKAFDKNGITIPYPHIQLVNGSPAEGKKTE